MSDTPQKPNNKPDSNIHRTYEENQPSLKRFIARLLIDDQEVEDVAQETFLKAFLAEQDKEIEQPKPFLFRIAKNIILSQMRYKKRHPTSYIEDLGCSGVVENKWSAEDEAMAQQKLDLQWQAVNSMSPQVRRVYLMRKVHGMPHKDIAEQLGIARSTVEKHLTKGLEVCDCFTKEQAETNQDKAQLAPSQIDLNRKRAGK